MSLPTPEHDTRIQLNSPVLSIWINPETRASCCVSAKVSRHVSSFWLPSCNTDPVDTRSIPRLLSACQLGSGSSVACPLFWHKKQNTAIPVNSLCNKKAGSCWVHSRTSSLVTCCDQWISSIILRGFAVRVLFNCQVSDPYRRMDSIKVL